MSEAPYRRVQVIVNPASGKDEPVLNVLNDVFRTHEVDWAVSVTHKYGDAAAQARQAIEDGVDLVAGYGGDGTQHEIANALVEASVATGRQTPMGILPGGTGNGFAREMGIPKTLREATEVLCTSTRTRAVDVGRLSDIGQAEVADRYFVQRMYVGVEREEQTSRELKDKYGVFAYLVNATQHAGETKVVGYRVGLDDDTVEFEASKVYVVNSGMMGTGCASPTRTPSMTACSTASSWTSATSRRYRRRCPLPEPAPGEGQPLPPAGCQGEDRDTPDQPVWTDGEYVGRTPVTVEVMPGALAVVVP